MLAEHGLTPEQVGRLTYPQLVMVLNRGKVDDEADAEVRARKALRDFRRGKLAWKD